MEMSTTLTVIIYIAMGALFVLALVLYRASKVAKEEIAKTLEQENSSGAGASGNANISQTAGAAALPVQGERPEIIAAAMGALIYTLEEGASRPFAVTSVTRSATYSGGQDSWALAGRNRLMQVRQDFALNKGRKAR